MKLNLKDIFSVRLYVEGLKKVRLLGIAAAITTIVLNAIWPVGELIDSGRAMATLQKVIEVSTRPEDEA